ncbi:anthranilate synthase / indole-3-glycerol phosphate synthase [Brettanomyces nanus]|uniref:Multifunctional tryptophan biosynthesis protein n=1 Tax=Eeniella nana TaxID=13502 RepID=A0A875S433_EENNA|nr:anthranilate synthase / indole-3-glycerol phosphate synthase [Brettanomyces nanus]QPG74034.1 anthranilate synthase / indole-3-glycerol phosphate synthase [Brettanomyces nanus]
MPGAEIHKKVVMIDNYDSFTWNLYQYLCEEGADVEVFRNDQISVAEIDSLHPDFLFISPGPGHPKTDSGISREAIDYFKGKIPIFGVCMGQQCIYEVFGGNVEYAGEIVHGKTSVITHDGKGVFENIPQGVAVTRYHSLAGSPSSLPDCLEVTAKTNNGVIMGVRHKKFVIEGVQFHPESILTEEGHLMIRNILQMTGGYWDDVSSKKVSSSSSSSSSILQRIYSKRKQDYAVISKIPGKTFMDLQSYYDMGLAPQNVVNFYDKLNEHVKIGKPAILSEIKRASPSKGDIDITANAAQQAVRYAKAGVSAISVLTEPHWFKGSIDDLQWARKSVDKVCNDSSRPCILRKEFVFCEYQILEARLAGADSVLLIVKMLTSKELERLFRYAKSLDMEPLVEVNTAEEMQRALGLGACVIGVNNRNLNNFTVDLDTTTEIKKLVPADKNIILLALSGISSVEDIKNYKAQGVFGFLIGEALMKRGDNVGSFIRKLIDA